VFVVKFSVALQHSVAEATGISFSSSITAI
jgi:hypothetical protein